MMEEPSPKLQRFTQNPSLPDDLLMSCVTRMSRLYYPTLSLVSKSFRSLLASPELYKARSILGHTESCVYVSLQSSSECRLYTLCRKPDQTLTNKEKKKQKRKKYKKSSGYVLVRVPILHYPRQVSPVLVAVGSDIYKIGNRSSYNNDPSSSVSVLDCRFHTWQEAPSMRLEYTSLSASVVDRKIYVTGSHKDSLKGSSEESRWELTEPGLGHALFSDRSCCLIDNVLYSASQGRLGWYDTMINVWRPLIGLIGLPKLFPHCYSVRLADCGGKMAVFWEQIFSSSFEKMICCAEISLERRNYFDIWGEVEWVDHVLTVPLWYDLVQVLAATV
ncbi:unnamed protein product [Microthlaspi erraticum]|uniref:F-box domain-containing protein n=1 Tax=Microthlaspi erraticum TaxID=1685480 RepID=A0A6D2HGX5_9BRAS|nr:unnamed protein product [Microthlaspi erraticum]